MRVERVLYVRCPSCHRRSQFTYNGAQRWPEGVADAAGMPHVMHLWTCKRCRTTLSEAALTSVIQPA